MDKQKAAKALFDEAVEFTSVTTRISTRGLAAIPINREPRVRSLRELPRALHGVDAGLRLQLRRLVSGEIAWPLYLYGAVGVGKTMAGLCVCDHITYSLYTTVEKLATAQVDRNVSLWDDVYKVTIAVLDEIGARQKDTDLHYGAIQRFADLRERKERVAIYLSNLQPSELNTVYDNRIADRLLCGSRFHLEGDSRR